MCGNNVVCIVLFDYVVCIDLYVCLQGSPQPDATQMTHEEAQEWLNLNWGIYMAMDDATDEE